MKSAFAHCDGPLPVPPGESPFHIKGEFYRQLTGTIDHFEKKVGGVRAALERAGLGRFMAQKFLASSMYDVLPQPRVFMAVAAALKADVRELTAKLGKNAIELSMKGVYASLFARLTPENFAERFTSIILHIYDFAPAAVTREAGGALMVRDGVPLAIAEWWCLVTAPFVEVPLAANGAREVKVDWKIEPRAAKPIPLSKVIWKLRWKRDTH
jgi:hypothetical protein